MPIYEFSDLLLDTDRRTLARGGREIELAGRAFDVLAELIKAAPNVVSKSELIDTVWEGLAVEDNCVERTVHAIRKALKDEANSPRFIKTIRSRGYLFVGDARIKPQADIEFSRTDSAVSKGRRRLSFRTAAAGTILIVFFVTALWFGGDAYGSLSTTRVFADDFSNPEGSDTNWRFDGSNVRIVDGTVKITVDKVDAGGTLLSREIKIDPAKPLSIRTRMRVAYNQGVDMNVDFVATFGIRFPGDSDELVAIKYANADGEFCYPGNIVKIDGFYLTQKDGDVRRNAHHVDGRIGPRVEPVWDEWFTQEIGYDPNTQILSLTVNDGPREEMQIGKLPLGDSNAIRIEAYPRGWWLHHSIELDEISITQPA